MKFRAAQLSGVEPTQIAGFNWVSTGNDPAFELIPLRRGFRPRLPGGWVLIDFELRGEHNVRFFPCLYADTGGGYSPHHCITLPSPTGGRLRAVVKLPPHIRALRFDPTDRNGLFHLGKLSIQKLTRPGAALRLGLPTLTEVTADPTGFPTLALRALKLFKSEGVQGLKARLRAAVEAQGAAPGGGSQQYPDWVARYDTLNEHDRIAIRARLPELNQPPLISVVMPVHDTPARWLKAAIESVRGQLYPHWQLCLADDASTEPHVHRILEEYRQLDPRIEVTFRPERGGAWAASNSALGLARGQFVALAHSTDELAEHALYLVAESINEQPDVDLIYSDEDHLDAQGVRQAPHFKPEWNPDLLRSQNYFSNLGVYRRSLIDKVGGFREGFDGNEDYDLLLRCAAGSIPERIRHIPHVLYHQRALPAPGAEDRSSQSGAAALMDHFAQRRLSLVARITNHPKTYRISYPLPPTPPLVSILIPTRDGYEILKQCLDSIHAKTTYPSYEIIVIDNQSAEPRAVEYLKGLESTPGCRVIRYDLPFNFSAISNVSVAEAKGELIALLNNDIEVITPDWLEEMVSHALRPEIGAVGAKLYYPNDRIQHAGVIVGLGGVAAHSHKHYPRESTGYFHRPHVVQTITAVTAACLVMRKKVYEEVGGMDSKNLSVAFNDVDLCLKVQAAGYRNLFTPFAELYHHESVSRGVDNTPQKLARFNSEIEYMKRRWTTTLLEDPFYSLNLSQNSEDFAIAWPPRVTRPWIR